MAAQAGGILGASGHSNHAEPSKGQDRRPGFSLYSFLPALKRLGWEDFANWKLGRISRYACFFLSSAQEARNYWGRNPAHIEGAEAWRGGTGKEPRGRKGMLQETGKNTCKKVLMEAKTGCWNGIGTYLPWPRQNSELLNSKCSVTLSQYLWKNNRSLLSYVSALLRDQFTWRSVKMMEGSCPFTYQTGF